MVFDWESAAWDVPVLWDRFHFLAQTECLLNVHHIESGAADLREANRAVYLLYLLSSVAQLSEEETEPFSLKYREEQVRKHISEPAQSIVAD
jgi:hypothetical protein